MKFFAATTVFAAAASDASMASGAISKDAHMNDFHKILELMRGEVGNFIGCAGQHLWQDSKSLTCISKEPGRPATINDCICNNQQLLSNNIKETMDHCSLKIAPASAGASSLKTLVTGAVSHIVGFGTSVLCGAYQADREHDKMSGMSPSTQPMPEMASTEQPSLPTTTGAYILMIIKWLVGVAGRRE